MPNGEAELCSKACADKYWKELGDRVHGRVEARLKAENERLLAALRDAHGFLSGDFYNEALGVLEDAIVHSHALNSNPNP